MTATPTSQNSPARKILIVWLVGIVGIAGGLLAVGLEKGGFLTTSDVGELAQLAGIQAQLRPLDACEIRYATRDKRGQRQHFDAVFITSCSRGSYNTVVIRVPTTWASHNVGFAMERRSPTERWRILVEKSEVPFPDLVAALEDFAPRIAASYADELAKIRKQMDDYDRGVAERRAADEARKQSAPSSYPSQ